MYHTESPTDKTIREWYMKYQQSGCLCAAKRTGSHSAEIHVPFTNCFVCRWFCVVHDPKPPLHSHNWLSFGKFQDTERFLIHCERHFSSRLPSSGGTWKCAKAPSSKKKLGEILHILICSFLPCLSWLLRSRVRKSRRDLWITLYYVARILERAILQQFELILFCIRSSLDTSGIYTWCRPASCQRKLPEVHASERKRKHENHFQFSIFFFFLL